MSRHLSSSNACSLAVSFRFVDLFAGIGGFHRALAQLGGECVRAVEIDAECRSVYSASFPGTEITNDVRLLTCAQDGRELSLSEVAATVPDHEVLCAGFPCQPFSKSGAQRRRDRTRGTLFFDVMTIVLAKRPEYVLLENVRNLAGPRHTATWHTIIDSLHAAGYFVPREPLVVSPHDLPPWWGGAPQARDRVFILARRDPAGVGGDVPLFDMTTLVEGWVPDRWSIEDLLDDDDTIDGLERYQLRDDETTWLEAWQAFLQGIDSDVLPGFPIWGGCLAERPRIPAGTPAWKADFLRKNSTLQRSPALIDPWLEVEWGPLRQRVRDFPASRRKFEWQARKAQPRHRTVTWKTWSSAPTVRDPGEAGDMSSRRCRHHPDEHHRVSEATHHTGGGGRAPRHAERPLGERGQRQGGLQAAGNAVNVGVVRAMATLLFEEGGAAWMPPKDIRAEA